MRRILLLLSLLLLAWCSLYEDTTTEIIELDQTSSPTAESTTPLQTQPPTPTKVVIPSPVHTLTGNILTGTDRVEIIWTNWDQSDRYELEKFSPGDREFVTHLRLDYGNIAKGENTYIVRSYQWDDVIDEQQWIVVSKYEEIELRDTTLYLSKSYTSIRNNFSQWVWHTYINTTSDRWPRKPLLIKSSTEWFTVTTWLLMIEHTWGFLFEIKNPHVDFGDLYLYWSDLVMPNFRYLEWPPGGGWAWFDYDPETGIIENWNWLYRRVYDTKQQRLVVWYWCMWGSFNLRNHTQQIDLNTSIWNQYYLETPLDYNGAHFELYNIIWTGYETVNSWLLIEYNTTINSTDWIEWYIPTCSIDYKKRLAEVTIMDSYLQRDTNDLSQVLIDGTLRRLDW